MLIVSRIFLCLMFLFVSACASSSAEQAVLSKKESVEMSKEVQPKIKTKGTWQQVTVKYLNFEGGFYGLVSEKGAKLLPMNLPTKYKIEGTILRVKGQSINNMMTIQQWGTPFKVIDIELIKKGGGKQSIL